MPVREADARAVTEPAWLPAERLVCRSAEVKREGQMPKHAEKPLFDRLEQLDGAAARQLTPAMQPVPGPPSAGHAHKQTERGALLPCEPRR